MRRLKWVAGLAALAMVLTFVFASDWIAANWSEVAGTIRKQLRSMSKPQYALLVFGPDAKTRVLVAERGETLYVDRNGDGDLTDKDERFTLTLSGENNQYGTLHDCNIEILDADKETRYIITSVFIRPQQDEDEADAERHLDAKVEIKGQHVSYRQYCDAKMDPDRDKAAIAHFHGPLTIGPRTINWKQTPGLSQLSIGDSPDDIFAVVGTMDAEHGCWVVVQSEDLPKALHPVVEIEYPSKKADGTPINERYWLKQRC